MKMQTVCRLLALGLPWVTACSTSPAEVDAIGRVSTTTTTVPNVQLRGASSSKYVHTLGQSRLSLGAVRARVSEFGLDKTIGEFGVWSYDPANGAVVASLNARAPGLARAPLTDSALVHDARVRQYFLNAGLPAEELLLVRANTVLAGHGPPGSASARGSVVGYCSVLTRAIRGVPVVDSVAWARFNDNDDVVAESVFWPEIPSTVADEAVAMAAYLATDAGRVSFRSKLPPEVASENGRVVIRHASSTFRGALSAVASYEVDVRPGRGSSFARHFGTDGAEFRLPQEQVGTPQGDKK